MEMLIYRIAAALTWYLGVEEKAFESKQRRLSMKPSVREESKRISNNYQWKEEV